MMKNKEYQREQLTIKFGTYYYKEVLIIIYLKQSYLYLKNGAQEDLLDILFNGTKNNCLVFVFSK